jgi:Tol biopolymer transport system component
LPGWLVKAGLVLVAFVATSCGDDNPQNPPTTGTIQVAASTTGDELDADGYTVTVDGGAGQALAINGSVTFTNQSTGNHEVELSGVAANCTITGDNPRTVDVTAGNTTSTTFDVTCSATTGNLEVTTVSTGDDIDSDGYTVSVDGGAAQSIGVNSTLTVSDLDAGDHTVELGDVAANCTVTADNPRTVAVSAGGTATTQFDVACTSQVGDLDVVVNTIGNGLPAGFNFTVDGGAPQAIGANDTVGLTGLTVGDHDVLLTDLANCSVTGDNPVTVAVPDGGTVQATFDVTCAAGSLDVTSNTWGLGLDSGYDVVIDAGTPQAIGANETVGFSDLSVGDHSVELTGVASNCSVDGTNPQTVAVADGETAATTFDVFCFETLSNRVVFESDRDGNPEIYIRDTGSGEKNLTRNAADDRNPDVAPDGTVVAFESNRGGITQLWRMCASGIERLTSSAAQEFDPSYAGDLSGLAYVRGGQIWKAGPNGGSAGQLTAGGGVNDHPAYSPDGQWVLFRSDRDGNPEIYVVNVATGVETNLTNNPAADGKPAWWSDGSKILWTSDREGNFEVYVADFDAVTPSIGAETNLTNNLAVDGWPNMRGDGSSIVFSTDRDGTLEIYAMDPDGLNQTRFAGSPTGNDVNPSWSP